MAFFPPSLLASQCWLLSACLSLHAFWHSSHSHHQESVGKCFLLTLRCEHLQKFQTSVYNLFLLYFTECWFCSIKVPLWKASNTTFNRHSLGVLVTLAKQDSEALYLKCDPTSVSPQLRFSWVLWISRFNKELSPMNNIVLVTILAQRSLYVVLFSILFRIVSLKVVTF